MPALSSRLTAEAPGERGGQGRLAGERQPAGPVILTTLLFGLDHGISLSKSLDVNVNYFGLVRTAFDGFLFALLVQKTKSIVPAVIYHNLLNLIGNH